MGDAVKCPLLEHSFNLLALTGSAAFKRVDHSHGYFAFAQIASNGLTQNVFGRCKVEHVISDLKRHTQIVSILRQTFFLLARGAAEDSTHAHAYGKQACGFPDACAWVESSAAPRASRKKVWRNMDTIWVWLFRSLMTCSTLQRPKTFWVSPLLAICAKAR